MCYIFLLHQTTTTTCSVLSNTCCVISFFYIKPQPNVLKRTRIEVVLYLSSTSNHNSNLRHSCRLLVVLYLSSTSNHNDNQGKAYSSIVVLYLSSTSNHNKDAWSWIQRLLCYIFLLHQTTTVSGAVKFMICCVISFFYIKPQHAAGTHACLDGCVISFFYIKPQPQSLSNCDRRGCVISFFYIKPQLFSANTKGVLVVLYLSSTSNHNCWSY